MFSFREAPLSCCSSLGPPPPSSPLPQLGLGSGEAKMSPPDVSTNVPHLDVSVRIMLLFTNVPIVVIDDANNDATNT